MEFFWHLVESMPQRIRKAWKKKKEPVQLSTSKVYPMKLQVNVYQ